MAAREDEDEYVVVQIPGADVALNKGAVVSLVVSLYAGNRSANILLEMIMGQRFQTTHIGFKSANTHHAQIHSNSKPHSIYWRL